MTMVRLSKAHLSALEAEAGRAAPHEACALLLGVRSRGAVEVTDIRISENVTEGDPATRFEVDPTLHLMLQRAARDGGPALVGVWHSHPNGAAVPSDEDRDRSAMAGWCWLITAVTGTGAETRVFMAADDDPHQLSAASLTVL